MLQFNLLLVLAATLCTARLAQGDGDPTIQTGLCRHDDSACTELNEGEKCTTLQSANSTKITEDWTTTCSEPVPDVWSGVISRTCVNHSDPSVNIECGQNKCVNSIRQLDLQLNYSIKATGPEHFLIDISWTSLSDLGIDVPSYLLVITTRANWDRCTNYDSQLRHDCVIELDNNTSFYRHQSHWNLRFRGKKTLIPQIYIKLIPSNWCDGPSAVIDRPISCHHLCPGNCGLCGTLYGGIIFNQPPTHLTDYSFCQNNDSTYSATFLWETNIAYVEPNPMPIFYFYLTTNDSSAGRFSRHIKVRQSRVTLHNLTLEVGKTYYIRMQQYECLCTNFRQYGFPFTISGPVPTCSATTEPELPVTSTTMISSSATITTTATSSSSSDLLTILSPSTTASPTSSALTSELSPIGSASQVVTFDRSSSTPHPGGTSLSPGAKDEQNFAMIAAVSGTLVILVVLVLVTITLVIVRRLWAPKRCPASKQVQVSPVCKRKTQLLVLYSWETSELKQQRILQCLSPLTYDTDIICSAKAHVRGDIPQWVERQVNQSDKVLIVCNRQFSQEWQNPGATYSEGAIVNAVKAIINGQINNGAMDKMCGKFALVFLKEKHKKLVPSRMLQSFKQYVLYSEDSEKQNELFRFVMDTPLFHFCQDSDSLDDTCKEVQVDV